MPEYKQRQQIPSEVETQQQTTDLHQRSDQFSLRIQVSAPQRRLRVFWSRQVSLEQTESLITFTHRQWAVSSDLRAQTTSPDRNSGLRWRLQRWLTGDDLQPVIDGCQGWSGPSVWGRWPADAPADSLSTRIKLGPKNVSQSQRFSQLW